MYIHMWHTWTTSKSIRSIHVCKHFKAGHSTYVITKTMYAGHKLKMLSLYRVPTCNALFNKASLLSYSKQEILSIFNTTALQHPSIRVSTIFDNIIVAWLVENSRGWSNIYSLWAVNLIWTSLSWMRMITLTIYILQMI